jgi:ankyrin repeat protein
MNCESKYIKYKMKYNKLKEDYDEMIGGGSYNPPLQHFIGNDVNYEILKKSIAKAKRNDLNSLLSHLREYSKVVIAMHKILFSGTKKRLLCEQLKQTQNLVLNKIQENICIITNDFREKMDKNSNLDNIQKNKMIANFTKENITEPLNTFLKNGIKYYEMMEFINKFKPEKNSELEVVVKVMDIYNSSDIDGDLQNLNIIKKKFNLYKESRDFSGWLTGQKGEKEIKIHKIDKNITWDDIKNLKESDRKYIKHFEDDKITIIQPLTEASSCYFGQGTKWCTAATQSANWFNRYYESSHNCNLYIVIPKEQMYKDEKYQICCSESIDDPIKDELDYSIDIKHFIGLYPSIINFDIIEKVKNNGKMHLRNCIKKINNDMLILYTALGNKYNDIVKLLYKYNNSVKEEISNGLPLIIAIKTKNNELLELLYSDNIINITVDGLSPLISAINVKNKEAINFLLNKKVNINYNLAEGTPLIAAIKSKNLEMIKYLIDNGATIDKISNNTTPLIESAGIGDKKLIQELLSRNVDINQQTSSKTALIVAIENKNLDLVKFLIEKGADVNVKTTTNTPLLEAIRKKNNNIIKFLLDNGADPTLRTLYDTPYKLANNDDSIIKLLNDAKKIPIKK